MVAYLWQPELLHLALPIRIEPRRRPGERAALLAFLCDAALNSLPVRRTLDHRMQRMEAVRWDWETAARAGLVQNRPLHALARVEPLGHDRTATPSPRYATLTSMRPAAACRYASPAGLSDATRSCFPPASTVQFM